MIIYNFVKKNPIVWLVLLASILLGCKTRTVYLPSKTEYIEKEILRDTTIYVPIEKEIQVAVADTFSRLENKYSESVAKYDGKLHHSLKTKDISIPITVKYVDRIVIKNDSIPYPVKGETTIKKVIPNWCWILLVINAMIVAMYMTKKFIKR